MSKPAHIKDIAQLLVQHGGTKKHNTAHHYDLAGNILKILERSTDCGLAGTPDQLDRKFSYDPMNRLLSATGREATTISDLDLWANPSRTGTGGNPAPSSMQAYTRTYAYDKMGNILQLKQTAGNTFTRNFHYDTISSDNLLHSIKKADNTTNYATFTYDSNGNKLTAGTTRNYIWDYADQLKTYLNQTGTSEPSVYAQYLYSGGQRVKKQVRTSGGGTETTVYIDGVFEHKYSGTNSQSIIKVGGVATVLTGYAFDGLSGTSYELSNHLGSVSIRLDSSGSVIDREEYYPFGDSSVRTWSGTEHRYAYVSGTKKHNIAHHYDLTGNILKILERSTDCGLAGAPDQLDRKFSYDPMNRLLSATGREATTNSDLDLWANPARTGTGGNPAPSSMQAYTRAYAYDKMGNILQLKQTAGNTFTRNFKYNSLSNNNLLHSIKKADNTTNYATFTYDANGNKLTAGTERKYLWGHADQLKAYVNQAGTGEPSIYAQYLYSGGQRVKKQVRTSGGGTETTVYIDGVFEHKYNGTNSQSIIKVGRVATVRTGYAFDGLSGTSYELSNHIGSVSIRLDGSGSTIDVEEYYPFGDSSVRTWDKKRYRYVGKEKDAESGLYYYGARYYSAWTCRFISVDPLIGQTFYQSSYTYADNNPVMMNDPTGLSSEGSGDTEPEHGTARTLNGCTDYWDGYKHAWVGEDDIFYKLDGVDIYDSSSFGSLASSFLNGFANGLATGLIGGVAVVALIAGGTLVGGIIAAGILAYGMTSLVLAVNDLLFNENMTSNQRAEVYGGLLGGAIGGWSGFRMGEFNGWTLGKPKLGTSKSKAKPKTEVNPVDESTGSETLDDFARMDEMQSSFNTNTSTTNNTQTSSTSSSGLTRLSAYEQLIRFEQSVEDAHFVSRHGAQTTQAQQYVRARTGKTPDGYSGRPVDASRFFTHEIQLDAYYEAISLSKTRISGSGYESNDTTLVYNMAFQRHPTAFFRRTSIQVSIFFRKFVLKQNSSRWYCKLMGNSVLWKMPRFIFL